MIGYRSTTSFSMTSIYRAAKQNEPYPYHWLETGVGQGAPIVLFHGIMASGVGYRFVSGNLGKVHPTILGDMVGHGRDLSYRSGRFAPKVSEMARWMVEYIEFLDRGPVHVVGHSLGGAVTYAAVRSRPDLFASATLVAPGFHVPWVGFSRHLLGRVSGKLGSALLNDFWFRVYEAIQWRNVRMNDTERESYISPLKEADRMEFMLKVAADLLEPRDRIALLKPLRVPTLLVWGAKDHILSGKDAAIVAEQLLATRFEMFPDSGHCPMEDEPTKFSNVVLEFIASSCG